MSSVINDASPLSFSVESFAKIAVANAVWLTGEWLAHTHEAGQDFAPDIGYLMHTRHAKETLFVLNRVSEDVRYKIFVASFMWRAYAGELLFRELINKHPQMLREALQAEWALWRFTGAEADAARLNAQDVLRGLLPRLWRGAQHPCPKLIPDQGPQNGM